MTGVLRSISSLGQRPAEAAPASVAALRGVSFEIDGRTVLRDIDLTVQPGAAVGIVGPNGSGKSTLLRLLATLSAPTSGRLELFGVDAGTSVDAARRRTGLVSHAPMLYRELSALANLEFFAGLHGVSQARARAKQVLDGLGLSDRAFDPVGSLSRGMIQRVAVGRALVHAPALLLLDEPLTGLDETSAALVLDCLRDARAAGTAIVVTGHGDDFGVSIAREVFRLCEGGLQARAARSSATALRQSEGDSE